MADQRDHDDMPSHDNGTYAHRRQQDAYNQGYLDAIADIMNRGYCKPFQQTTPDFYRDDASPFHDSIPLRRSLSVSTNATADNLPGPGRALDNLYQSLGRRFESIANRLAVKAGLGPAAQEAKIIQLIEYRHRYHWDQYRRNHGLHVSVINRENPEKYWKDINVGCKRLIKYTT